ncbi:MAG: excinuclease ABC subunit UvrC, partial [Acidobacteriota bacterium]
TGRILYIGKARNLRSRVRSYFHPGRPFDLKTETLRAQIADLEHFITDNELEAFILESNLVKRNKPLFNIQLKDDKSFLYIKLTTNEDYPRILLTRRLKKDGAMYFGPYVPASLAKNTVKLINRHFQLRTCDIEIDGNLPRPCLEYDMKRCLGPCVAGLCTKEAYDAAVRDVVLMLQGKNEALLDRLREKMLAASDQERFEIAAFYRDRIQLIEHLAEKQKMRLQQSEDLDVFAYYKEGTRLALELFAIRGGRIIGKNEFYWEDLGYFEPSEFLKEALQQYYAGNGFVPAEIHLSAPIQDGDLFEEWLSARRGRRVRVLTPQRGVKQELVELVEANARIAFESHFRILKPSRDALLQALQRTLALEAPPERIEAFDISNLQGSETVASMVVCINGLMTKSEYRKFRIHGMTSPDDFAAMRQVVRRRYRRLLQEGRRLPDLVLIDGGKGQLQAARDALAELGLADLPVASLAKREEWLFVPDRPDPIVLPRTSPVLHLVQQIRDESHRFAISYHRKRRSLRDITSMLEQIPGIGPKRKKRLLRNFGSLKRIEEASLAELIPFVGESAGGKIREYFEKQPARIHTE